MLGFMLSLGTLRPQNWLRELHQHCVDGVLQHHHHEAFNELMERPTCLYPIHHGSRTDWLPPLAHYEQSTGDASPRRSNTCWTECCGGRTRLSDIFVITPDSSQWLPGGWEKLLASLDRLASPFDALGSCLSFLSTSWRPSSLGISLKVNCPNPLRRQLCGETSAGHYDKVEGGRARTKCLPQCGRQQPADSQLTQLESLRTLFNTLESLSLNWNHLQTSELHARWYYY